MCCQSCLCDESRETGVRHEEDTPWLSKVTSSFNTDLIRVNSASNLFLLEFFLLLHHRNTHGDESYSDPVSRPTREFHKGGRIQPLTPGACAHTHRQTVPVKPNICFSHLMGRQQYVLGRSSRSCKRIVVSGLKDGHMQEILNASIPLCFMEVLIALVLFDPVAHPDYRTVYPERSEGG